MFSRWLVITLIACASASSSVACAGVMFGSDDLTGGWRWDAAPRTINGNERSLDGGLRFSLQGGSFAAYRDQFQWSNIPTVDQFQQAVMQAFAAWTATDPVSGLHSALSFVPDLATPVIGTGSFDAIDPRGAEIDLLAVDAGEGRPRAVAGPDTIRDAVTLTSGTANYLGSEAIAGADVIMNNNAGAHYSLDTFRRLLTHELGHTLGLSDVETAIDEPRFIDDNFDDSTSASIVATVNNSWALQIDPHNPATSPLALHQLDDGDPGNDTLGVDLLMESNGLGISAGNPVSRLVPLTNDEFAMRQFLYPSLERDVVVTGDYNGNGVVDAADYVVWRDTLGQTVFWPGDQADGDQSGTIDQGDYTFWKNNFGNTVPGGGSSALSALTVPEPTTSALAVFAASCLLRRIRKRAASLASGA